MNTEKQHTEENWARMAKKISGNLPASEEAGFESWLKAGEENEKLFKLANKDWEMADSEKKRRVYDVDKAWTKFADRIDQDDSESQTASISMKPLIFRIRPLLKIAAIFVIGFVAIYGSLNVFKARNSQMVAEVASLSMKDIKLPDATLVTLNKQSKLEYPQKFATNSRAVKLEGEAFFDVHKDASKPFIITTQNAEITVLGTSFNVKSAGTNGNVEVSVKTGKVRVKSDHVITILVAGEKGIFGRSRAIKESWSNENFLAWKTRKIECERQTIAEIIRLVNSVYNVQIEVPNPEIARQVMGKTTYDNDPLDSILTQICQAFDLQIHSNGKTMILDKK